MFKKIFLILPAMLLLVGCGQMSIGINNVANSNLNNRGDDVPITVIVYQLNDIKKFEEASEMQLLSKENETLGRDKIDSIKLQIQPNTNVSVVNIDKDLVPYVAILVLYANQDKAKIKEYKKTADVSENFLLFRITDKDIKAFGAKTLDVDMSKR